MVQEPWHKLIDAIYDKLEMEYTESMYEEHCNLLVNGVSFTLSLARYVDDDSLIVYGDFGLPPDDQSREIVLQKLLEENFGMMYTHISRFGFNPETGHVIVMTRYSPKIKADNLIFDMANLAEFAHTWRMNHTSVTS